MSSAMPDTAAKLPRTRWLARLALAEACAVGDTKRAIEILDLHMLKRTDLDDTSVVDQDVDLAELVLDLLEDIADLLSVGHVHLDRERLAAHLADLFGRAVGMHPALRHRHLRQHAALRLGGLLVHVLLRALDEQLASLPAEEVPA